MSWAARHRGASGAVLCAGVLWGAGCGGFDGGLIGPGGQVDPTAMTTDVFEQVRRPRLDFLWVVDSTQSMAAKQSLLFDTYRSFFDDLGRSGASYQVGVVTADRATAGGGALLGDPWILTPDTPSGADKFVDTAQVAVSATAVNHGLEAMRAALTPPLSQLQNRGLVRPDAGLAIFFVSDTDDESTWPGSEELVAVEDYVAFLTALKGDGKTPVVSAIVGPPKDGCSSGGVTALPADRYGALVSATGGEVVSICAPAARALDLPIELPPRQGAFQLSHRPASAQIAVWVDAQRASSASWTVEGDMLVFDEAAVPDYEATIRVQYQYQLPETSP